MKSSALIFILSLILLVSLAVNGYFILGQSIGSSITTTLSTNEVKNSFWVEAPFSVREFVQKNGTTDRIFPVLSYQPNSTGSLLVEYASLHNFNLSIADYALNTTVPDVQPLLQKGPNGSTNFIQFYDPKVSDINYTAAPIFR